MKENKIFVVTAYRWGDRKNHSYILGVFSSKWKAMKCADSHCEYRGQKYACLVEQCYLNEFDNKDDSYSKEIYRAKSVQG